MSFIAGLLTFILLLNSLLLVLLVLVQLPKKDAGAGLAFGGGTADALFGAGSGNALTKITKWGTVAFIGISLVLGYVQDREYQSNAGAASFLKSVDQQGMQSSEPSAQPAPSTTKNVLSSISSESTNTAAPAATNPAK